LIIEIATFRPKLDDDGFIALDKRLQADFVYQQHGCVRRTTARRSGGEWLALTFWQSMKDAEDAGSSDHPLWREYRNAVQGWTVLRYSSL
jgi:hypothetical protein